MYIFRALRLALLAPVLMIAACRQDAQPLASSSGAAAEAPAEAVVTGPEVDILALGDSLFAGYGLNQGESYPARLEAALRARGINAHVSNAGVSGNTSADGLARLAFTLANQPRPPRLAILSLGANDMLRGLPPAQAKANLDAILTEFDKRHVPVVIMGMLAAPNLGKDYGKEFNAIYPALAKTHDDALVPFFLAPVISRPDLVLPDHMHPTAKGVDVIVKATIGTVVKALPK
jgi:acyl-CoA thioesterase-1